MEVADFEPVGNERNTRLCVPFLYTSQYLVYFIDFMECGCYNHRIGFHTEEKGIWIQSAGSDKGVALCFR